MTELQGVVVALLVLAGAIAWLGWEVNRVYRAVAPLVQSDIVRGISEIRI